MSQPLRRTPLFETHRKLGARMVPFAGWDMPLQYDGILVEHEVVRKRAGIFDVSHMGRLDFTGAQALTAIQRVFTNDASRLEIGGAQYTMMCHSHGGIVDDCILYKLADDHYRVVVNASNVDKDLTFLRQHVGSTCQLQDRSGEFSLLAVAGPKACTLLESLSDAPLRDVPGFMSRQVAMSGVPVLAARTGYTGEDSFELFVPAADSLSVWQAITAAGARPVGLGARDTLRMEARLTLYGNDIDATTNPYEAGLGWTVKLEKGDFVGREALRRVVQHGLTRKLVGFRVSSRGIARAGADVIDEEGAVVGRVTSGGPGPTVGGAIGMAYVPVSMAKLEEPLRLLQRGKELIAKQVNGPFYRRQDPA